MRTQQGEGQTWVLSLGVGTAQANSFLTLTVGQGGGWRLGGWGLFELGGD